MREIQFRFFFNTLCVITYHTTTVLLFGSLFNFWPFSHGTACKLLLDRFHAFGTYIWGCHRGQRGEVSTINQPTRAHFIRIYKLPFHTLFSPSFSRPLSLSLVLYFSLLFSLIRFLYVHYEKTSLRKNSRKIKKIFHPTVRESFNLLPNLPIGSLLNIVVEMPKKKKKHF